MRVAVLGAGGTIAPAIVQDLADSAEVSELLLLDLDVSAARMIAAEHGGGKARATSVDAAEASSLAELLGGTEVLVNAASYRVNLDAMEACLEARCHYMDLGGLYWMTSKQLGLAADGDPFASEGLLALLGIGSAPGKTNLMAARAVSELRAADDSVISIDVAAAGRDANPPDGFSPPYAVRTLVDELTMSPIAVRGGAHTELEPLAAGGTVDFGEPIGEVETIHTLHSEALTFPTSFGAAEVTFRLSLRPELLARLRELADAGEDEIDTAAREAVPPSPETTSIHVVEARGRSGGVRIRSITPPNRDWGLGGGVVSTATPVAAAVRLLSRGQIRPCGIVPPELCIRPTDMFAELEQRGVRFEIERIEEARGV